MAETSLSALKAIEGAEDTKSTGTPKDILGLFQRRLIAERTRVLPIDYLMVKRANMVQNKDPEVSP